MTKTLYFALLSLLLSVVVAKHGVDVSQPTSEAAFSCMVKKDFTFAVIRAYRSSGSPDPNAPGSIHNAHKAGMHTVDVYMFPCPTCGNPAKQVSDTVRALHAAGADFRMLWPSVLDVVSQFTSQSAFSCMVSSGYSFAVVRAYRSSGSPDPNAAQSIRNAWSAGMRHVDAYMFPCPTCGNPAKQVSDTINNLRNAGVNFGMLWLDIEGTQYWTSQANNRNFFNGLVNQAHAMGVHLGVYTSKSQWEPIMGDWNGGASMPLWYAHYDNSPSFGDFSAFGGWSKPAIKQYAGDASLCGAGVDMSWYP